MRTKYKLTIRIADFVIYENIYDFTEAFLTELLQEAAEDEDFVYCINDGSLDSMIHDFLNKDLEDEGIHALFSDIKDLEWYEKVMKYPEFTVATIICQKVFWHNIFGDFRRIDEFFSTEDMVKEQEVTNEMEQYSWECIPID